MIKLSGFPSPTVSVYELYLLILVSLWKEREKNSLHSFQIYVIRYGSVLWALESSLFFYDDDMNEQKKRRVKYVGGKDFHKRARHVYKSVHHDGWD